MTAARARILSSHEAIYHCISRCVRRAYLCGFDKLTQKNFDHRKDWVRYRLRFLSQIFGIEVLSYALMSTHSHVMLRTRPDILEKLTDQELAYRWLKLYPREGCSSLGEPSNEQVANLASEANFIAELRKRLGSISWFMKSLNEYIARRANKEDDCKGRFWEGRFKAQRIYDSAGVLACSVYVDLNPVRAKVASTPEESEFTSIFERIKSVNHKAKTLHERPLWIAPIADLGQRRGFLPLSLPEYLALVDETGRALKKGKRGQIPLELEPILKRIGIEADQWMNASTNCAKHFGYAIGTAKTLRDTAHKLGQSWLKGVRFAQQVFA